MALNHLKYLIELPHSQYAHAALMDSMDLISRGKPCWIGDIKHVLHALPVPVSLLNEHITSVEGVDTLIRLVKLSCAKHLHDTIQQSPRVPLLHGRIPDNVEPSLSMVVKMRPYLLEITVGDHRLALTRLLCGAHCLAIEEMRHKRRRREPVPRNERLCRFCRVEVEDEPHALLSCDKVPLNLKIRRELLLRKARQRVPEVEWGVFHDDRYDDLRPFLEHRTLISAFAAYVYHVLETFAETDLYYVQ